MVGLSSNYVLSIVTLAELLDRYGVEEREFVEALSRQLQAQPTPGASRLTVTESTMLGEHGQVPNHQRVPGTPRQRSNRQRRAWPEVRDSVSVDAVAALLHIDGSRVRHRVRDGALYGFKVRARLRLPVWQFHDGAPLPALRAVLTALPDDLHPLEAAGFLTTPMEELAVADVPRSPRDWLAGGGGRRSSR